MKVLTIDIGNSALKGGLFIDGELEQTFAAPAGQLARFVEQLRRLLDRQDDRPQLVAASVNELLLEQLERMLERCCGVGVKVVRREIPLPMKLAVSNPQTVGTDRVLAAAAAYTRAGGAVVVADFGTAVTIDCVDESGTFLGGAILPGLAMAADALHEHTSALPRVSPRMPAGEIGTDTEQAILSGIYYGLAGALREIVERMASRFGRWPILFATGGDAELMAKSCNFIDSVQPHLVLEGIYLAYAKAKLAELEES